VLTLGMHVPPFLAPLAAELAPWGAGRGIRHLDAVGPVRRGAAFTDVPDHRATVVALLHPSLRHASLRHRRYGALQGQDAELAMLRHGLAAAGVA
jgi:hypothetical protein